MILVATACVVFGCILATLLLIIPKAKKSVSTNGTDYVWDNSLQGLLMSNDNFMFHGIPKDAIYSKVVSDQSISSDNHKNTIGLSYNITSFESRAFNDIDIHKTIEKYIFTCSSDKIQSVMLILTPYEDENISAFNEKISTYFIDHFSSYLIKENKPTTKDNGTIIKGNQTFQDSQGNNIFVEYGSDIDIILRYKY
jgi:hypothetical protein